VPELASGEWSLVACRLIEARKHRRKRIVTYQVAWRQADGGVHEDVVVVKVYGSDRGAHALETLQALWDGGFRPPHAARVPRPLGYSPLRGALVQAAAPGRPWADALAGDEPSLRDASTRAADWLLSLERSSLQAPPRDPAETAASVRRFASELTARFGEQAGPVAVLADRVAARLGDAAPAAPSHGDYHPKNVFVAPDATTVIDFDTFGRREPGYDAGYAIGQLYVMSHLRHGSFRPAALAAGAFWDRYALDGRTGWQRVATHIGRTLVQSVHFELCTLRNDKTELLRLWPELAGTLLDADGPEALADSVRVG
jgi:hypothetical protein